ncbi:MAG: T9SS type A sorting domain-containing protein [Lentimicrobiaceae bacterium]|nr:T9SS type A sorting domain-containing protein [Lentimicrobiaceae bacterium]
MKRITYFIVLASMMLAVVSVFGQGRASHQPLQNVGILKSEPGDRLPVVSKPCNPFVKASSVEEAKIGETRYDLQTNTATQNRLWYYPDGTIGATWTMGLLDPAYADRGTGYSYFDGTSWGGIPSARIENVRTGWPSYAPYGASGEIVVSHDFAATGGLVLMKRTTKGSGTWMQSTFQGPASHSAVAWPRMITAGAAHDKIHMIYVTKSTVNGGSPYQGLEGALLYARSTDGGSTWAAKDVILPGMDATSYYGFSADGYTWAAAKGDTIAFVFADSWIDMVMMKSNDGGVNWTKTVIWEHPYPKFNGSSPIVTDTFYCPDGSTSIAFDNTGKAHVFFGVNRAHSDGTGTYWFPFVDGIGYWNEDMPPFSSPNFKYTLNPDTLYNQGKLVAWTQDVNQNDTMDFLPGSIDVLGKYYLSLSSMPNVSIDENNDMFLVYSSATEGKDNGTQNYRHLWFRSKTAAGWSDFKDLTGTIIHNFHECVFPSIAPLSGEDHVHLIYQQDGLPGLSVRGDEDPPTDNSIIYMKVAKVQNVGLPEQDPPFGVSDVYPNPSTHSAFININVLKPGKFNLDLYSVTGERVWQQAHSLPAGLSSVSLPVDLLATGIYVCRITDGTAQITRRVIVK